MRINVKSAFTSFSHGQTHEGAPVARMTDEQALRRSVMSCLLWENEFYEDGKSIADRIVDLCAKVKSETIGSLAMEARLQGNLRHVPLLLLTQLVKRYGNSCTAYTICNVIARADELTELVALYWKMNPKRSQKNAPLPAQMKKGLARAFLKFDEYRLAKYNRDNEVKLRDVLFLCHAKPDTEERAALWKRLVAGELKTPDTWEVELSAGHNKKETFERLIREQKLGYLALLRNLRNMREAGVDFDLVNSAIVARKGGADRVLPFRFIAAARACPQCEPALDVALQATIAASPRLPGRTVVLVDVSGSMDKKLSGKSDMTRIDAAAALASVVNAEHLRVFSFSNQLVECPPRRGMAGVDAVVKSQQHAGTELGDAVHTLNMQVACERIIVITDEQSHDRVPAPVARKGYMINVASARNGVGYGPWIHIDGFSENVIRFIAEIESASERN